MFRLLLCLLWVQLLASDEINERQQFFQKFFPKNSIEMGETRSIPTKSFDTFVARPILISTEDTIKPDANSTSDGELTTRSPVREDTGCLRMLYMKYNKWRKPTEAPEASPERSPLPRMKTEYDANGKEIDFWRTETYQAAINKNKKQPTKEEIRMESWRKSLNEAEPALSLCCCCCISRWCN